MFSTGADLEDEDVEGNTALLHSSHNGYAEVVKALIEGGEDENPNIVLTCLAISRIRLFYW